MQDVAAVMVAPGGFYALGEYRGTKAETVNYRDKQTGNRASFSSINHVVETGDQTVTVQERLPDGADIKAVKPPFKKGQKVLVQVESIERVSGFIRATGTMTPVDA